MDALSIDDVARTTDPVAVRKRFDERNQRWVAFLLVAFALASVIGILSGQHQQLPLDTLAAYASAILAVVGFFVFREVVRLRKSGGAPGRWRVARAVENHVSASVLTYLALQYLLFLGMSSQNKSWAGWIMVFPMIMIPFRMLVSELVLLHVFLFSAGAVMTFLLPDGDDDVIPLLIASGGINGFVLGIELFASWRMRKEVVAEWGGRRTQALVQIRMRDELQYARELQLSMLPECAPALDWADICGISVPATEVGGDYYDYFTARDRVALVCGDVAGHGMASGLALAAIRSGFTLLRDSLSDPAAVLRRLHDLIAETSRRRMLVTVSVVLLDRAARTATIASAGHPPVILRRRDGSAETIELFAPPLGVRLPVDIPQRRIDVDSGDLFVLHSDGIYETRNDAGEVYGIDRLIDVVRDRGDESAEAVRDAIVDAVARFRGNTEQEDDVTVVVCRVC